MQKRPIISSILLAKPPHILFFGVLLIFFEDTHRAHVARLSAEDSRSKVRCSVLQCVAVFHCVLQCVVVCEDCQLKTAALKCVTIKTKSDCVLPVWFGLMTRTGL